MEESPRPAPPRPAPPRPAPPRPAPRPAMKRRAPSAHLFGMLDFPRYRG
jgi:hypothetical protein